MSNTKFTRGPWKVEVNTDLRGNPCSFSIVPTARPGKRNIIAYTPDGTTAEHRANAALLAAAPDMYEVLIHCISELERASSMGINIVPGVIEDACDALRKARGEA